MNRRGFLTGLIATLAAPAIVRSGLIMPIKPSLIVPETIGPINQITIGMIRDHLLPGLFDVSGSYEMLPRQWARLFAQET
jgi:hypothetical protein